MCNECKPFKILCAIQIAVWILASLLLLHGGITYVSPVSAVGNLTNNIVLRSNVPGTKIKSINDIYKDAAHDISGIIMIFFGVSMLLAVPIILLVRSLSNRKNRYTRKEALRQDDCPPKYEDVVESVPQYSTLLTVQDGGQAV